MLLDEYCPLMQNTEKRIRLRTKCFEAYEELCKSRQYILMLPPSVDLGQQQVIPLIVPSTELLKQADNILPPLFAPLAGGGANIQPLIIKAPAIKIIEAPASLALPTLTQAAATTTTTTTTTTSTSTTTTTTPAPIISGNSVNSLLTSPTVKSLKQLVAPDTMNETNDNETLHQSYELQTTTEHVKIIEEVTATKLPLTNANSSVEVPLEGAEGLSGDNISTQKPSILVVNIDDADASNVASNPVVDSEYATVVEYIPNPEISSPQVVETEPPQPPPPDVLIDEDSKSNAIHEEYHTKILADYGSAPQNLLQPVEPPENP